ncbi:MAG: hypothetical protein CUN55_13865, partial [Phototrophicales bacterium]
MNTVLNTEDLLTSNHTSEEEQAVNLIYRFATQKDEWFNLLLSLSNCLEISDTLPASHPYKDSASRLLTHLRSALRISLQLQSASQRNQATALLKQLPIGALIIDAHSRVIECNELAKSQIAQHPKLCMVGNYLFANQDSKRVAALDALFSEHKRLISQEQSASIELPCHRQGKAKRQRTLRLHITPLNNDNSLNSHYYVCLHPSGNHTLPIDAIRSHFELTETEALVASTLVNELTSQNTANRLGIKESTVRGHLSNIYDKVGVTRKQELIRKLLVYGLVNTSAPAQPNELTLTEHHEQSQFIYLRDGRKLCYSDHIIAPNTQPGLATARRSKVKNDSQQTPQTQETILLLHNLMGSRMELPPSAAKISASKEIRIIVPERPGYGDSDPHPSRTHKDFCMDVVELLD